MGKQLAGKKILQQITARLVPPDHHYPDCICSVVMTEDAIHVLEDNYDGTNTCHFRISLDRVLAVKKYLTEDSRGASGKNPYVTSVHSASSNAVNRKTSFFILPGFFAFWTKGGSQGSRRFASKTYLRINYKNEQDKTDSLFFEDCDGLKK